MSKNPLIIKLHIRPVLWQSQPSKYGQIRCWEIFREYSDGTIEVQGEYKTFDEAYKAHDKWMDHRYA